MYLLDDNSQLLVARGSNKTTNEMVVTVSAIDLNQATGAVLGYLSDIITLTSGTTSVIICASPAFGTIRVVNRIEINNQDTIQDTIELIESVASRTPSNTVIKSAFPIPVSNSLSYENESGWYLSTSGGSTDILAGDVTGPITSNTVAKINGTALGSTTATAGNLLVGSGSQWVSHPMSGDATIASAGALSLNTVNSNVGTFGSATQVPQVTLNAKGLVTAATNVTITGIPPGGTAGGDLSGTYPNPTVAKINGTPLGTTTPTSGDILVANGTQYQSVAVSGDATLAGTGALTLNTVNSNTGAFGSATQVAQVTLNAKGLVTGATNVTITGVAPGGTAGGDLSGTYPNPTVAKINGTPLGTTTPTSGDILIANGTQYQSAAMSGDVTIASSGATTVGSVGGSTASAVHTATVAANNATSANTVSTIALRDANGNFQATAIDESIATTVTAAGTTTLTVTSSPQQRFTGTTTQTVVMPNATTLNNGRHYRVMNRSTGIVTVQANGGSTLLAQAAGTDLGYTLISNATSAGTWDVDSNPSSGGISALTGDVTASGSGSVAATVAKVNGTTLGTTDATNWDVLAGNGTTIASQAFTSAPQATATVAGLVPTPPNNAAEYLRGDATWQITPRSYTMIFAATGTITTGTFLNPCNAAFSSQATGYPVMENMVLRSLTFMAGASSAGSATTMTIQLRSGTYSAASQYLYTGGTLVQGISSTTSGSVASKYYVEFGSTGLSVSVTTGNFIFCVCSVIGSFGVTDGIVIAEFTTG